MTLYQYIINHQMQADSIANHLGTTSGTTTSYESYVEMIGTFCQTIDHANRKAVHKKNRHKALQTEYQQSGSGRGRGRGRGHDDKGDGRTGGCNPGCGRQGGRGHSAGRYHNWIPKEQFDCLDQADINNSYVIVLPKVKFKLTILKLHPYLLLQHLPWIYLLPYPLCFLSMYLPLITPLF